MPLLRLENKHVMARKAAKLEEALWKRKKRLAEATSRSFFKRFYSEAAFFQNMVCFVHSSSGCIERPPTT